mmetsp:Transcript_110790/g.277347  ORF Transcript_110790/g.277347 Transcript_110790/m.277347 type:complete len:301 (+) Transcript_110790:95-997(+)|eukprot:CAMPEP_0115224370 /NCGR_PEP_ID=MMETSP0270-20121206/29538_1 /TAXON_ID=71861 /ORGANISM="Scrippsiella trochoidea, Strain CCMP3099" /LENGTH=300 /DNA_ID=CAMNT_0002638675 /DNA_START=94 /DNA_END=996 /DNA_ORIENTATION=-
MSNLWRFCGADCHTQEQEDKERLDSSPRIAPTLMQSQRWGQGQGMFMTCNQCTGTIGAPAAEKSHRSAFGLEKLRRMAEAEAQSAGKPNPSIGVLQRHNSSDSAAERDLVRLSPTSRWGPDEVWVGPDQACLMARKLEAQLDAEWKQAELLKEQMDETLASDEEQPCIPPVVTGETLLQEDKACEPEGECRARAREEAMQRSQTAREERAVKEKVRAFLTVHGYRHVRAKCINTTMSKTHALHKAVWCNDADMTRLLLLAKADMTQVNTWGQTPLQYAQRRSKQGSHAEVVRVLQEAQLA